MTSDARKLAWMASLRVEGETMITKPIHYWTLWRGKREYLLFYFTKHRRFELNFIVNSREISTLTHLAASIALHCLPPEEYAAAIAASITRNYAPRRSS